MEPKNNDPTINCQASPCIQQCKTPGLLSLVTNVSWVGRLFVILFKSQTFGEIQRRFDENGFVCVLWKKASEHYSYELHPTSRAKSAAAQEIPEMDWWSGPRWWPRRGRLTSISMQIMMDRFLVMLDSSRSVPNSMIDRSNFVCADWNGLRVIVKRKLFVFWFCLKL